MPDTTAAPTPEGREGDGEWLDLLASSEVEAIIRNQQAPFAALVPMGPGKLVISGHVSVDMRDGTITYEDGYDPDEAARMFWAAISDYPSRLSAEQEAHAACREALELCYDALAEWEDDYDTSGVTTLHTAARAAALATLATAHKTE